MKFTAPIHASFALRNKLVLASLFIPSRPSIIMKDLEYERVLSIQSHVVSGYVGASSLTGQKTLFPAVSDPIFIMDR